MSKKKPAGEPLTKIEGGNVSMSRKSWRWWVAEVNKAIGLDLSGVEPGTGRTVKMPLEVWQVHTATVKAGLEYSGYARGGNGCEECCDGKCKGHGGRDFCFGSACVCGDGDLFDCGGAV